MEGLLLTFNGLTGWKLEPGKLATGFQSTVQCALVNVTTQIGTNTVFPKAGTTLLQQGAVGLILDLPAARHACNFAAAEARSFVNSYTDDSTIQIDQFNIQPVTHYAGRLDLELRLESTAHVVYGNLLKA